MHALMLEVDDDEPTPSSKRARLGSHENDDGLDELHFRPPELVVPHEPPGEMRGLFATCRIPANTVIGFYIGPLHDTRMKPSGRGRLVDEYKQNMEDFVHRSITKLNSLKSNKASDQDRIRTLEHILVKLGEAHASKKWNVEELDVLQRDATRAADNYSFELIDDIAIDPEFESNEDDWPVICFANHDEYPNAMFWEINHKEDFMPHVTGMEEFIQRLGDLGPQAKPIALVTLEEVQEGREIRSIYESPNSRVKFFDGMVTDNDWRERSVPITELNGSVKQRPGSFIELDPRHHDMMQKEVDLMYSKDATYYSGKRKMKLLHINHGAQYTLTFEESNGAYKKWSGTLLELTRLPKHNHKGEWLGHLHNTTGWSRS